VVEQDRTTAILDAPRNDYTRNLLAAVPRLRISAPAMNADYDGEHDPSSDVNDRQDMFLVVEGLSKTFSPGLAWRLGRNSPKFALRDVNIELRRGTITGIVGESGSGKTTLGRVVAGLDTASAGRIVIGGNEHDISKNGRHSGLLGRVQMIFQDPAMSLNPRMTIEETLSESIRFGEISCHDGEHDDLVTMMDRLGLARNLLSRYPHQLSGGQKQRACIARALLARPQIIVADEPTSALDVSVQAEIVRLLNDTITERDITMIFISHDLAVVQQLCDSLYIFRDGQVEDAGPCDVIFSQSGNPYTRTLISARPHRFTA
jgi:peptide/nickel transport system ATP-binding protein